MDEKLEEFKSRSNAGIGAASAAGGGALIAWAEPRALAVWALMHAALATAVLLQGAFAYVVRRGNEGSAAPMAA